MKKYLKIIVAIAFIGVLVYFGYQIYAKIQYKKEVAENIKSLPAFEYKNINGGVLNNKSLKQNTSTLFIYFNSECEFCNQEAQMLRENIDKFKPFQLLFVSFEKPESIKVFALKHQLNSYDNVHFLYDSKVTFATTFDVKSLPCLVLYDKNQQLIEKIKGQTKPATLIQKLAAEYIQK